jgi:hypothetical protein
MRRIAQIGSTPPVFPAQIDEGEPHFTQPTPAPGVNYRR